MSLQSVTLLLIMPALGLAIVLAFIRLLAGPSLPDRVVALDLITTIGIGIIAAYGVGAEQPVYLDVAIVVALLSFVGTIAFAAYVERRKSEDGRSV
ncbi:MAG: Na(+)/H(+) antiporter subunit F [bacterium]|nr:Na(+)/H(+) antiporter subunit F [bacterium]